MLPKPDHLTNEFGVQFQDQSIADVYDKRPPYPAETLDILLRLIVDQPAHVLELGCGTGDIARRLAPRVTQLDAVDPSAAMLAVGKTLSGGEHTHLRWIQQMAEEFTAASPYALVIAAESLHWMNWQIVLPKIKAMLTPNGKLAIILGRNMLSAPWDRALSPIIASYSTNRKYQPYDLIEELTTRKLFTLERRVQTLPEPFTQSVEDYVESIHSRNGFSRERMGDSAVAFDAEVTKLVTPHSVDNMLSFDQSADIAWGVPVSESQF